MKEDTIGLIRHEDIIQPFMLHNSTMRGRMVRIDHTLNAILERHAYPDVISRQLGELLVLGAMLSANLPEKGILTLQIKGDAAVSFMVVDVQQDGSIRGYANMTEGAQEQLEALAKKEKIRLKDIIGKGYLAITLDMGYGDPYQGIVPLDGDTLADAVRHYFSQSQQLDVAFHIHISRRIEETGSSRWVAAGIMLERMPEISASDQQREASLAPLMAEAEEDTDFSDTNNWDYHKLLIETATEEEMSDPHLAPSALLYRLFNQGGVWVYDTQPIQDQCRCSRSKVEHVLHTIPKNELESMANDGIISVICQFCSREEAFTVEEL